MENFKSLQLPNVQRGVGYIIIRKQGFYGIEVNLGPAASFRQRRKETRLGHYILEPFWVYYIMEFSK